MATRADPKSDKGKKGPRPIGRDGADFPHALQSSTYLRDASALKDASKVRTFDKKLKRRLQETTAQTKTAVADAVRLEALLPASAGLLQTDNDVEQTHRLSQHALKNLVDEQTALKMSLDLSLPSHGPYSMAFSRNGRSALLCGRRGHVALMRWQQAELQKELFLGEPARDAVFLQDEGHFAVAQNKYVYVYDGDGVELHRMSDHIDVTRMTFLPYHFLLVTLARSGYIKWHDISTGQYVAGHRTRLGESHVLAQNSWNAVTAVGHMGGAVTMWAPAQGTPLMRIQAHKGAVSGLSFSRDGVHMVSGGMDGTFRVWDVRHTRSCVATYHCQGGQVSDINVSQRGLIAVSVALAQSSRVEIWHSGALSKSKEQAPYMTHTLPHRQIVNRTAFCPYEDFLGIGHSGGVSMMAVPGAGEPNFDSWVANPFETRTQAREGLVRKLMDKLSPDMITLDPTLVGEVREEAGKLAEAERKKASEEEAKKRKDKKRERTKMKGKGAPTKRHASKQEERYERVREALRQKALEESGEAPPEGEGNRSGRKRPRPADDKSAEEAEAKKPKVTGQKALKDVLGRFTIKGKASAMRRKFRPRS
jgi:U3 small nucleolar RNA-associated protein 7